MFDKSLLLIPNRYLHPLILVYSEKGKDSLLEIDDVSEVVDWMFTLIVSSHWEEAVLEFFELSFLLT